VIDTASLLQKYGKKWNYSLGINDLYFDGMVPGLAAASVSPSGQIVNISAGDGSLSAYQRIQTAQYQDATIPEPLHLHGWQLVDELNRSFAGQPPMAATRQPTTRRTATAKPTKKSGAYKPPGYKPKEVVMRLEASAVFRESSS